MMTKTLTYWIAEVKDDNSCYNIRGRRKKDIVNNQFYDPRYYETPRKVTVEYDDAFDLVKQCLQAGGAHWEPTT
jgi:hypothetical protein